MGVVRALLVVAVIGVVLAYAAQPAVALVYRWANFEW
jgi:hypothetical protein